VEYSQWSTRSGVLAVEYSQWSTRGGSANDNGPVAQEPDDAKNPYNKLPIVGRRHYPLKRESRSLIPGILCLVAPSDS